MNQFLSNDNFNYLLREVRRRISPQTPVKVIVPKLRSIMADWFQYQYDMYGKSIFELNDKFMHDMIMEGLFIDNAEVMGLNNCSKTANYSQFNISLCSGVAGPTGLYNEQECPRVIGDCPRPTMTTPDLDAYYMKMMPLPNQQVIDKILHRNKTGKCLNIGSSTPSNKVVEEEYCDTKINGHRRMRCGRCIDNSPQCDKLYGYYETDSPGTCMHEPKTKDFTI